MDIMVSICLDKLTDEEKKSLKDYLNEFDIIKGFHNIYERVEFDEDGYVYIYFNQDMIEYYLRNMVDKFLDSWVSDCNI